MLTFYCLSFKSRTRCNIIGGGQLATNVHMCCAPVWGEIFIERSSRCAKIINWKYKNTLINFSVDIVHFAVDCCCQPVVYVLFFFLEIFKKKKRWKTQCMGQQPVREGHAAKMTALDSHILQVLTAGLLLACCVGDQIRQTQLNVLPHWAGLDLFHWSCVRAGDNFSNQNSEALRISSLSGVVVQQSLI